METKLDYIPKRIYSIYSKGVIIEYRLIENRSLIAGSDDYTFVEYESDSHGTSFLGKIYNNDRKFFYLRPDGYYLTKKEAYHAYIEILEIELENTREHIKRLQSEESELMRDLNILIKNYEKEIEL